MWRTIKHKTLFIAHKYASILQKYIEQELRDMEPFSREDERDEVCNRYPDFCG